jgi:hypothetical protein
MKGMAVSMDRGGGLARSGAFAKNAGRSWRPACSVIAWPAIGPAMALRGAQQAMPDQ